MSEEVIFRAIGGALKDEEFVFDQKGLCLVGRSGDCALLIPKEKDMRISRRHCLFILDPPKVRIRDLGSRNGTFVNGEQLSPGTLGDVPEQNTPQDLLLKHKDQLSIGETEFEVLIPSQVVATTTPPPPGTKIIKLAKPSNTQTGTLIPKSEPVNTGFFIAPGMLKGKNINTATAPLTEAFMKPKMETPQVSQSQPPAEEPPKRVIAKKVTAAAVLKPLNPAPDATLILRAKPPAPPEEIPAEEPVASVPPTAHVVPAVIAPPPAPVAEPEPPRKVLKGKIIKKPAVPPAAIQPGAEALQPTGPVADARKEYSPELTEVMDINDLSDDIKLSVDYIKKEKANKRVTKFKVKGPKK